MKPSILSVIIIVLIAFSCRSPLDKSKREEQGKSGILKFSEGTSAYSDKYEQAIQLINQNRFDDAEKIYEELLVLESNKIPVWIGLAAISNQKGLYDKADSLYTLTLKQDPDCYTCYLGIAGNKISKHEYKVSIIDYRIASELNPEMPDPFYGLAICFDYLNETDSAKFYASKFLSMEPNSNMAPYARNIINKK